MDTQASIVKFVDSNIDQIIEWASIDPEKVVEEFQAAGYRRSGGGPIEKIAHLQDTRLGDADTIARRFRNIYTQMASGQGFVTGLGGLITLPASVPADAAAYLGWLARTGSAIRLCYGFEHRNETADAQLKLAMAAGAGVSSVTVQGTDVLITQLSKKVMTTPYAHAPIQATVKALAAKVGITLTHRSFAKAVPVVGGVVNGSVHGGLVYFGARRIHDYYRKLALHEPDTSDDADPAAPDRHTET
jgi:hypothetical protein